MYQAINTGNSVINWLSNQLISEKTHEILKLVDYYRTLSNSELQTECRNMLVGISATESGAYMTQYKNAVPFGSLLRWKSDSGLMVEYIALGIASFDRAPADLPPGSRLYTKYQIPAAFALTQQVLIQMDTGEGKTYTLLPAAFALACKHHRVYIICANNYLAHRDATRTQPYWEFMGLQPGLCLDHNASDLQWSARIIYTTLKALVFKSLLDEILSIQPNEPLSKSAVLLDEADAILLDQADQTFVVTNPLKSETFDWSFALDFARKLEKEDIVVEPASLTASLTLEGERKLEEALKVKAQGEAGYFLMRFAVENTYIAVYIAKEDRDYVLENNHLYSLDRVTGEIMRDRSTNWLIPLEFSKGLPPRPLSVILNDISPRLFLKSFKHLSGLSGTVEDDALEYFFSYSLPIVKFPSRNPRYKEGDKNDLVFSKRPRAINQLLEEVATAVERGQPVLIGTQNIADANTVHQQLMKHPPPGAVIHLLTGKNETDAAKIFADVGQVGSVLVATQLAGRGVDIRLTEEARRNGGLAIFSLGRSLEMRYDKQFLGRAGRQGDPFYAQFICSLDDDLLLMFGGKGLATVMERLGVEDDIPIEHPLVTSAIKNAQRKRRYNQFLQRRTQGVITTAEVDIRIAFNLWFDYLQAASSSDDKTECPKSFVMRTIDLFIKQSVRPLFVSNSEIQEAEAKRAVSILLEVLGLDETFLDWRDLDGRLPNHVCEMIRRRLTDQTNLVVKQRKTAMHKAANDQLAADEEFEKWGRISQQLNEIIAKIRQEIRYENDDSSLTIIDEEKRLDECNNDDNSSLLMDGNKSTQSATDAIITQHQIEIRINDLALQANDVVYNLDLLLEQLDWLQEVLSSQSPSKITSAEVEDKLQQMRSLARQKWEMAYRALTIIQHRHRQYSQRTPREIAAWRLKMARRSYIDSREYIKVKESLKGHTSLVYYRTVTDRITKSWEDKERTLPQELLHDLLLADKPEFLNELFFLVDNWDYSNSTSNAQQSEYTWIVKQEIVSSKSNIREQNLILIDQFVTAIYDELTEQDISRLRGLLDGFLEIAPLTTLQTPERIYDKLKEWFKKEMELEITRQRREFNKKWLSRFLAYLRERNRVGPLPDTRIKVKYNLIQFTRNMSELQTFLPLLNTLFFLGIFLLGIRYGNVVDPKHQSVLGQHVDNILFGGLLATGNVMAACFALPTLLYMFARIRQQDRQWILASGYANLIQIVFAAWFADWSTGWPTLLGLTKVAAIFALAYVMSDIAKNTTFHLYQSTSIDLTMGWLCYTNLFVFLPALVVATSTPWLSLTTLVIATAFFVWLHEINVQEVMLESARITGEGSSAVGTEQISIGYIVLGGSGIHPHIFSILFAYLTYQIVNLLWVVPTQWLVMGSTVGIYLLIFIIWTTAILNRRLSPHLWQAKLNQDRQRLSNITKETQLKDVLHSVKQRLYWRELGANVLVIVIMLMVFYGDTMSGTSFPLALLLTFAVILLASSGRSFLAQLYDFMISRTPHHTQEIDLSKLPDLDEELSLYQRIKRFFDSNIGQTLAIIFVICQIILFFHDGIRVLFDLVTSIMP